MAGRRRPSGQSQVEWALLIAAGVGVAALMTPYIYGSIGASVKTTEMQLNGAMQDNRP